MSYLPFVPSKTAIETDNDVGNALSNVKQLIEEYSQYLELKDKVYLYDRLDSIITPTITIVFEDELPVSKSLGSRCNLMSVRMTIFFYFETYNPGQETYSHVCRLNNLIRVLYDNSNLYELCHSEPLTITGAELVGRRLPSDVYLTGQISITAPVRFCRG